MDFNRTIRSAAPINTAINDLIEAAAAGTPETNVRQYLVRARSGASACAGFNTTGWSNPEHSLRTRDIFHRGHVFERLSRQHLVNAGFRFAPDDVLSFRAVGGLLRGHADGIIIAGPASTRRLSDLPLRVGTQMSWNEGLACDRARRHREGLSTIPRSGLALSGLPQ